MAKKTEKKKIPAPDHLTLKLNVPGMTAMHRAGLGGLAATLHRLTLSREKGKRPCSKSDPLWHDEFDWNITPTEISLHFGKTEWAGDFFEWLFQYAFQVRDGLIFLPGQYGNTPPPLEVRAKLQNGLTLTFLQHGQTRKLGTECQKSYEYDHHKIDYEYKECLSYVHQSAWKDWINNKGELVLKNYDVQGPLNPGAVVRHNAFAGPTKVSQPLELVLPLIFALVGTLALPINRAVGVLITPYINDLTLFKKIRYKLTPDSIKNSIIGGTGDAVLQYKVRCKGSEVIEIYDLPGCDAIQFRPMPWSTQQKSRSDILSVTSFVDPEFFVSVMECFPPRLAAKVIEKKNGRGKNAETTSETIYFWGDGLLRAFIADNIVRGKNWFSGFADLMNRKDTVSNTPLWKKIKFEREGLNKMVKKEELDWKLDGARSLVIAVQEALRCRYGQVSKEGVSDPGIKNRLEKEYDRWRLAFSGSKTQEQFRYSLSDLFSRAKGGSELKDQWESIIRLVQNDWQSARDLALIGLASYKGKGSESVEENQVSSDDI